MGTIRRLGKVAGEVVDQLEHVGGSMTLQALADALGVKRPRDLRRNTETYTGPVARLETAGVVECSEDTVSLTPNWLDALHYRREEDQEIADHRRDEDEYEAQRDAYRNRHKAEDRGRAKPREARKNPPLRTERVPSGVT